MTQGTHQPAVAVVGGGITGVAAAHRLLSPRELLRAGFDFVLPPTRCDTELSIAVLIGGRMGQGVVDAGSV